MMNNVKTIIIYRALFLLGVCFYNMHTCIWLRPKAKNQPYSSSGYLIPQSFRIEVIISITSIV